MFHAICVAQFAFHNLGAKIQQKNDIRKFVCHFLKIFSCKTNCYLTS